MSIEIKKGDKFKCIANYISDDDTLLYEEGTTYISYKDMSILDETGIHRVMENEPYFFEYFEEVVSDVKDNINPDHYKQGKVECIDALEAATVNKTGLEAVCTANIIKYIWRYESKNGVEDCEKAKWYLNKLINHLNTK